MAQGTYKNRKWKGKDVAAIAVIVCLTAAAVLFASLYALSKSKAEAENSRYKTTMENVYRKSYYGLVYNTDGLETAVTKLSVARSKAMKQEYLSDMTAYSTAAAENMANLSERGADNSAILKFINQTGDFAKYLDNKLNKGGDLTEKDEETIGEIASVLREIKTSLQKVSGEVEKDGFSFLTAIGETEGGFSGMVKSFENEEIDYPSMIYDGPFSDSMTERRAKGLTGKDATENEAIDRLSELLPNTEISEISVHDGSKNVFETFDFELSTSRGKCFVTIAKKGAFPVAFSFAEERANAPTLTAERAERAAEEYAENIGLSSMKAVWASNYDGDYYVNLAYTEKGVIFYPDLIKVKVNGETGEIEGMESLNYIFNHTARAPFESPIPPSEAVSSVGEDLEIKSVRLCVVPTKGDGETLAYEVYGTKGEEKYFVYVGASSGEELKVMRVVDGERGLLLQ